MTRRLETCVRAALLCLLAIVATSAAADDTSVNPAITPSGDLAQALPACGNAASQLLDLAAPAAPESAVCAVSSSTPTLDDLLIDGSARLGYCHCGCTTARCRTSADCGGASCDPTISCC